MTQIRDGLRALAEQAPRGTLPDGFYERVRARHRGRRAAAVAAVAVLLVVAGIGWGVRLGGDPPVPGQAHAGAAIATALPVPPWYTGGSGDLGVTAAIYGGPATTGEWQEGRFAGLSADGRRCRYFTDPVYGVPGSEVLLSPDGTRIARDGTVTSLVTGAQQRVPGEVRAFSPDGTLVVHQDGPTVGLFDLARRADIARIDVGDRWVVPGLGAAVAPGNDKVALMLGPAVVVYDVRTGTLLDTLPADAGVLTGPGAWLPDGSAFATAYHTVGDNGWQLVLNGGTLTDQLARMVPEARWVRLLGWRADHTAVAIIGDLVPGAAPIEAQWAQPGPYAAPDALASRVVEVSPTWTRTVLRTPAGIHDLDVAADLAVAGAFGPPGDPGYGARSNPVVYLSSMFVFVGGAMLAAVLTHRRRTARRIQ
ncbi:hypothetical protein AB0K00_46890 [Dactylosporangium sp. NPDC049525]|uniref:hypothetical protein n=1 Tax=Dactylosporangium sp. NPDC049525 TaxID=3154730 RepID=UPI003422FF97